MAVTREIQARAAECDGTAQAGACTAAGGFLVPAPVARISRVGALAREGRSAAGPVVRASDHGRHVGRSQLVQCASRRALESISSRPDLRTLKRSSIFVVQLGYDLKGETTPFCSTKPNPFRNRLVREALNLAVDRSELVARLSSFAVPAFQPVPSFVFGYSTKLPEPRHDPEAARACLARAGLPNGFHVTLHMRRQLLAAATILKEQLGRVGVRLRLEALPDPEFFDLVGQHGASLFLSRWGQLTGDAGEMFDASVHTPDPERHLGALNFGGHSNRWLDRSTKAGRSSTRRDVGRCSRASSPRSSTTWCGSPSTSTSKPMWWRKGSPGSRGTTAWCFLRR